MVCKSAVYSTITLVLTISKYLESLAKKDRMRSPIWLQITKWGWRYTQQQLHHHHDMIWMRWEGWQRQSNVWRKHLRAPGRNFLFTEPFSGICYCCEIYLVVKVAEKDDTIGGIGQGGGGAKCNMIGIAITPSHRRHHRPSCKSVKGRKCEREKVW